MCQLLNWALSAFSHLKYLVFINPVRYISLSCFIAEETEVSDIKELPKFTQLVYDSNRTQIQFFLNPKYVHLFLTTLYFLLYLSSKIFPSR